MRRCSVKIMYERMDPEQLGIVTLNAFLDEFFPTDSHKAAEQVQSFTVYHYNGLRNSCPAHKVWPTATTVYATSVLVTMYCLSRQWSTQLLSRPQGMVYRYNGLRNFCPHYVLSITATVYATLVLCTRYGLPLQWSTQLLPSLCTVYRYKGLRNSCPAHKVWSTATMVYVTSVLVTVLSITATVYTTSALTMYCLPLQRSTQLLSCPQGIVYRYNGLRNFCPGHCVLSIAAMVYATSGAPRYNHACSIDRSQTPDDDNW